MRPLAVAVCDADAAAIRGKAEREPARPNTLAYTPKVIDLLAHRKLPMRAIHSVIPWSDAAEALVEPSHKTVVARTVAASADHIQPVAIDDDVSQHSQGQPGVFNIKGNDYRLIAVVQYTHGVLMIRFFGSHCAITPRVCAPPCIEGTLERRSGGE